MTRIALLAITSVVAHGCLGVGGRNSHVVTPIGGGRLFRVGPGKTIFKLGEPFTTGDRFLCLNAHHEIVAGGRIPRRGTVSVTFRLRPGSGSQSSVGAAVLVDGTVTISCPGRGIHRI